MIHLPPQEYPWPAGKAPWSVERGGTGIPPDRARENWGRNKEFTDHKPAIPNGFNGSPEVTRSPQRPSGGQRLPAPGDIREPRSQAEAVRMLELSQKLMQVGCQYLEPSLSSEVRQLCDAFTCRNIDLQFLN